MLRTLLILAALSAVFPARADLPRIELTAGFYRIEAEVAANQPDRSQGLMNRRSMGANQGMLFVFPASAGHCFWMKNTLIPLSIAFLDEKGSIINVDEMAPQTENNHCPKRPARFALEMNAGWFKVKGLREGIVIGGIDRAPAAQ